MYYEVNTADQSFAPVRDALVQTMRVTAAGATSYLQRLRATQFERFAEAVRIAKSEDHLAALVRVCFAQAIAEEALAKAHEAATAIGRLPADHTVEGLAIELIEQTEALAMMAGVEANAARELLHLLTPAVPAEEQTQDEPRPAAGDTGAQQLDVAPPAIGDPPPPATTETNTAAPADAATAPQAGEQTPAAAAETPADPPSADEPKTEDAQPAS